MILFIRSFMSDESGATAEDFGLMLAGIAVVILLNQIY